jgi:hypothetical protein
MRTTSRLAVSAAVLGGGLLLAAPVSAQEATTTPCPYPFDCPTPSPTAPTTSPTTSPTGSPTTSPTTSPTASPTTSPIGGGGGGPSTGETPAPTESPAAGGAGTPIGGGGGGPATVVDNPTRGAAGVGELPFTGGEVTLIALAGVAAVGGGVALAAAGRKRRTA